MVTLLKLCSYLNGDILAIRQISRVGRVEQEREAINAFPRLRKIRLDQIEFAEIVGRQASSEQNTSYNDIYILNRGQFI